MSVAPSPCRPTGIPRLACLALGAAALASMTTVRADDDWALGVRTTEPVEATRQRASFRVPEGFEIQLVAHEPDIHKPMNLAFDAAGRLWVTTSIEYPFAAPTNRPARDRLMIFEDFGADGRARRITEFAGGLNIPIGVHPWRSRNPDGRETWKALVWSIPHIWYLEDTDGDGRADRREPWYGPFDHTRDTHGNQASFRRGFDGWLYATHGFNNDSRVTSRDGNALHLNSGNTYRMRLDGTRLEHHTWGQVNPFGLTWDERGNLYSSDCHSAPIYQLLAGAYYPSFGKPHDGLGFAPVLMEHAHGSTAIDGACYLTDDLWPAGFRDHFLVGNVMTSRLNHDHIVFTGSTPRAVEQPDFLTSTDPWFRPVDTCLSPDGALYVADFYNRIIGHYEVPLQHPGRDRERGRIWRVVPKGTDGKPRLRPAALATSLEGLVGELASGSLSRRLLAMEEIQDRFGTNALPAVRASLAAPRNPAQAVHGLWMLRRLGGLSEPDLIAAAGAAEPLLRIHAQRVALDLLDHPPTSSGGSRWPEAAARVGESGLMDSDALVRRCAAEVLGRVPSAGRFEAVFRTLMAADQADTHLVHVLRKSMRDQLRHPAVADAVLAVKGRDAKALAALGRVALAVEGPAASGFLLRELDALQGSGGVQPAEALNHASRHVEAEGLGRLVALARARHAGDPAAQLALMRSVEQGLRQRGKEPGAEVAEWGAALATELLAGPDPSAGWSNVPHPEHPTADPWEFQERAFADGTRGRVLSSFPRGEGLTGVLRSPAFEIRGPVTFWLCGHDGYPDKPQQGRNLVRLRDAQTGEVLAEARPPRDDTARQVTWPLPSHLGRRAVMELVDGDTAGAFAWLAVGRLDAEGLRLPSAGVRDARSQFIAAADLAGRWNVHGVVPALKARAETAGPDAEVRLAAARAWMALEPTTAATGLVARFQDATEPAALREGIGELLAGSRQAGARDAVLSAFKTASQRVQARWAVAMAATTEGAGALLAGVRDGRVAAVVLRVPEARAKVLASGVADAARRVEAAVRELPPEDAAREALVASRRKAWDKKGAGADVASGRRLFEQQCAACHQVGGQGGLVGPQLTGVGGRGAERLCEDVLDPNRNVDHAFRQTLVTLKSGETLAGLFRREEGEQWVLANAAGAEVTVRKSDVASRSESALSLMPDNFGEAMGEAEFVQLLGYLLTLR